MTTARRFGRMIKPCRRAVSAVTAGSLAIGLAIAVTSPAATASPVRPTGRDARRVSLGASRGWPFLGYDRARTGFNPNEHVIGPANVGSLEVEWSRAVGPDAAYSSPVLTRHGTLVLRGGDYRLWGIDASTGARRWRTRFEVYSAAPGIGDGAAYIGDVGGRMFAVDAASGARLWTSNAGTGGQEIQTAPTLSHGLVLLGLNDPEVLAMDASTGALGWASRARTCYIGSSSPAVAGGVEFIGDDCGNLWALDAATGAVRWHVSASTSNSTGIPAVGQRFVYATGGELGAFDPSTGARIWARGLGQSGACSSPAVANGFVFVSGCDGTVYAFHARSGLQAWTASIAARRAWLAIANGVLYVAADRLYAFDSATGERLLAKPIGGAGSLTAPIVADGRVYVLGDDGRLYALRP